MYAVINLKRRILLQSLTTALAGLIVTRTIGAADLWIRAGAIYRSDMTIEVSGTSRVQAEGVHAAGLLLPPSSVGEEDTYANRTYDDGYVKIDPGTGNPNSIDPRVTWYWGYNRRKQYDPRRETLTFHRRGLPGYAETLATPFIEDIAADQQGLEVAGGINLREGKLRISLCGGVQTLWGDKQTLAGSTYQEAVRRVDVTDVYDVTGINIPDAPHRGTYAGPFDDPPVIPSPTIPNKPKKRVLTIRDLGWTGSNHITLDIESDLYSFWMGGLFSVGLGSRFSAGITPRISINHVKTDLKRVETFTLIGPETSPSEILNVWTDEEAASEWIFGCGLTLDLGFELGHRWSLGITGGHDWLADSLVTTVGPATVTFDATGYSLGVWLAKSF